MTEPNGNGRTQGAQHAEIELDATSARQGIVTGRMVRVLAISLALTVVVFVTVLAYA